MSDILKSENEKSIKKNMLRADLTNIYINHDSSAPVDLIQ